MSNYNHVTLMGFLGADPEVFGKGHTFAKLRLAVNKTWKKEGQKQTRVDWFTVLLNKTLAELAALCLQKGDKILIDGELKTRCYQKNGQSHYETFISAQTLRFLSTKSEKTEEVIHTKDDMDAEEALIAA